MGTIGSYYYPLLTSPTCRCILTRLSQCPQYHWTILLNLEHSCLLKLEPSTVKLDEARGLDFDLTLALALLGPIHW